MSKEVSFEDYRSLPAVLDMALGWNTPKPQWFEMLPQIGLQNLPAEIVLSDYLYKHEVSLVDTMVEKGLSEYTAEALVEYLKKTSEGRIIGTDHYNLKAGGGKLTLGELRELSIEQLHFIEGITVSYRADAVKALIG